MMELDDGGSSISCSICLEVVDDNGQRSWAKLQCSHRFHLDCIGSAFNAKGSMQCPNCRKIEKGQWLFANGSRSLPEFSIDDWSQDEDLNDITYSDLFGFHWCPFGEVAGIPSSFEEGEVLSSTYQNPLLQHALFADHTSAALPCPYITYLPLHPSSSNSNGGISDASNSGNHWNGPSAPSEIPAASYGFPTPDRHYRNWEHHSSAFTNGRVPNGDHSSSNPISTQRSNRTSPDVRRSGAFVHPSVATHSSGSRPGRSVPSTLIPPYLGSNARTRDRVRALQAYYQQQRPNHSISTRGQMVRRPGPHQGMVPVPPSSDQTNHFYFFPTGPGRSFQEPESMVPNRMQSWERDYLPSFLLSHVDRDSSRAYGSDPGLRHGGSFRHRHGLFERTSSNTRM